MSENYEKGYEEIPDLLYPTPEKREELNRRRIMLGNQYPCTYIDDLMTENAAYLICRRNPLNVMKLFRELCTDKEVMLFRLDALEDVINNPKLSPALHQISRKLLDCSKSLSEGSHPDSFTALSSCIEALETYAQCMEELHGLFNCIKENIRSQAFKRLFGITESKYSSEDFASIKRDVAELKEAFASKIRSVTVAINFNSEMRPVSAGITGWSDKHAGEKPSVFDRLFYKNAVHPDTYVLGKLRTNRPNEDGYVSEADKALFRSIEKITNTYLTKIESALKSYDRLAFEHIAMTEDQLEIFDGMVRIIESARSRGLEMCRPVFSDKPRTANIRKLFDPCFFAKAAAAGPEQRGDELLIRNDIVMNDERRFFILTGANNGGKTTFARGAGLCFLMAQTGFYVPAESCEISICDFIFTHFPKEEETGINASRFTVEIKDLKTISDLITDNSLLLMNESIQSTTPRECCEIAGELLKIFCIIGVRGIFVTHITELALMCDEISADKDCRSVPVSIVAEADESTGKRLYRIRDGLPLKQSYAMDIFRSFGIDSEAVRRRIRSR